MCCVQIGWKIGQLNLAQILDHADDIKEIISYLTEQFLEISIINLDLDLNLNMLILNVPCILKCWIYFEQILGNGSCP